MAANDLLARIAKALDRPTVGVTVSTDDCQEWDGNTDIRGYGRATIRRRKVAAHRLVWEEAHGPIPRGMFVCHRCDNPPCINVEHLFLGTHQDNMDDRAAKGRTPRGRLQGSAKLTDANVEAIIRLRNEGLTYQRLADMFGVNQSCIGKIVTRQQWTHVGIRCTHTHNRNRKLTVDQVRELRAAVAAGESFSSIARRYGISRTSVSKIGHGRFYSEAI